MQLDPEAQCEIALSSRGLPQPQLMPETKCSTKLFARWSRTMSMNMQPFRDHELHGVENVKAILSTVRVHWALFSLCNFGGQVRPYMRRIPNNSRGLDEQSKYGLQIMYLPPRTDPLRCLTASCGTWTISRLSAAIFIQTSVALEQTTPSCGTWTISRLSAAIFIQTSVAPEQTPPFFGTWTMSWTLAAISSLGFGVLE